MFSDDGHEHSLSPPHNNISDADYGDSQCSSSIQEGGERIELYFTYSSYHPEASTPCDPLFISSQLSLFTTPNPLRESLL
ncbi:Bifunctional lycopene cyclase/phytoene synthase [Trichinella spiralis]|uniref:Bifunctional lycopene cyclase/phytoene synthase n=1 Tax=Trichinella spiralis TaxID=6334 RepID=A0ABR3KPK5_TRISP